MKNKEKKISLRMFSIKNSSSDPCELSGNRNSSRIQGKNSTTLKKDKNETSKNEGKGEQR